MFYLATPPAFVVAAAPVVPLRTMKLLTAMRLLLMTPNRVLANEFDVRGANVATAPLPLWSATGPVVAVPSVVRPTMQLFVGVARGPLVMRPTAMLLVLMFRVPRLETVSLRAVQLFGMPRALASRVRVGSVFTVSSRLISFVFTDVCVFETVVPNVCTKFFAVLL